MENKGILITMRSCKWKHILRNLQPGIETQMGDILYKSNQSTLLELIKADRVYGFLVCDVETPNELIETYGDFLFPWIIKRHTVTQDLMSPVTRENCDKESIETVIQTYNGTQLLIVSTLAKFYMKIGLRISNVTTFIQFEPNRALKPFVDKVIQLRSEAKLEGDTAKSLTAKLVGNSGYGKTSENVTKHKTSKIHSNQKKYENAIRSRFCVNSVELFTEMPDCLAETTHQKKTIKDSKPVHMGVAILQEAKLLFMEFMFFLFKHLEPGSFKNLYCDTDSIAIGKVVF